MHRQGALFSTKTHDIKLCSSLTPQPPICLLRHSFHHYIQRVREREGNRERESGQVVVGKTVGGWSNSSSDDKGFPNYFPCTA